MAARTIRVPRGALGCGDRELGSCDVHNVEIVGSIPAAVTCRVRFDSVGLLNRQVGRPSTFFCLRWTKFGSMPCGQLVLYSPFLRRRRDSAGLGVIGLLGL